jgi:hypothetical protein
VAACSEAGVLSLLFQQMLQAEESLSKEVDELLNRLLSDENVGPALDRDHLDQVLRNGPNRMLQRVPPGYEDFQPKISKGRSLEDALGDLVFWEQVLKLAADRRAPVVIVTAEKKADWWEWNAGVMRSHPGLSAESRARTGKEVSILHIDEFVDTLHAPAYLEELFASFAAQVTTGLSSFANALGESYARIPSFESLNASLGLYDVTKLLQDHTRSGVESLNASLGLYDYTKASPDYTRFPGLEPLNANPGLYDVTRALPDYTRFPGLEALAQSIVIPSLASVIPDYARFNALEALNTRVRLPDLASIVPDYAGIIPNLAALTRSVRLPKLASVMPDYSRLPAFDALNANALGILGGIDLNPAAKRLAEMSSQVESLFGANVDLDWFAAKQAEIERLVGAVDFTRLLQDEAFKSANDFSIGNELKSLAALKKRSAARRKRRNKKKRKQ